MTYQDIIRQLSALYETGEARAIARLLMEQRFGLTMADVLCGKVSELSADDQQELQKIMKRLLQAEPIQYVLGEAWFCGRSFHVAPGVLIPRPETEELCRWVLESAASDGTGTSSPRILDIGTGSGCIAITLAAELQGSRVTAWDISDEALRQAAANARSTLVEVAFEKKDVLRCSPTAGGAWDIIVSNPPYIYRRESVAMARNVLDYEPHEALFAPGDKPDVMYQAICRYAGQTLRPGGSLYLEMNPMLTEAVAAYLPTVGMQQV